MTGERRPAAGVIARPTSGRPALPADGESVRRSYGDDGARGFLAALQLGDSLFPSGGFTLSHGLETLAERGHVRTAAELHDWLAMTLANQIAPADGVATAAAWDAYDTPATVREIDALLMATKLAREPREASLRTGRQLLATLAALVDEPSGSREAAGNPGEIADGLLPRQTSADGSFDNRLSSRAQRGISRIGEREIPRCARDDILYLRRGGELATLRADVLAGRTAGTHAVVLGVAGRALGIGRRETVLLLLHLHVAGCIGAALRLLDVDDVEMQRVRLQLTPTLCAAMDAALSTPWKEMYACAPQTELMTMLHERATVRLFAT